MRVFIVRHGQSEANQPGERWRYGQAIAPNYLSMKGVLQSERAGKAFADFIKGEHRPGRKLRVFYSPVKRAEQTMDYFLRAGGLKPKEIRPDGRLVEQDFGGPEMVAPADYAKVRASGMWPYPDRQLAKNKDEAGWVDPKDDIQLKPMTEADKKFLDALMTKHNPDHPEEHWPTGNWYDAVPPSGESGKHVLARVRDFLNGPEMALDKQDEDVVIFTHSGTASALKVAMQTLGLPPQDERRMLNSITYMDNAQILRFDSDGQGRFHQQPFDSKAQEVTDAQAQEAQRQEAAVVRHGDRPKTRISNPMHLTDFESRPRHAGSAHSVG